ncbi:MAG TPA: hypothetical protein PLD23_14675 [Armatimonadota bacterium]|nr:hypothetical protein [Actinomycetota bacterium]HQK94751.1 hypothetical protein [Armatimonadota bacterium]
MRSVRAVVSGLLLVLFGLASFMSAAVLLLGIVPRAAIHMTSNKVLAGALVAMGIGAFVAALDPYRHRLMIAVAALFASFAAGAILYRLHEGQHVDDPVRLLLPFVIAYPVLALIFFPCGRGSS